MDRTDFMHAYMPPTSPSSFKRLLLLPWHEGQLETSPEQWVQSLLREPGGWGGVDKLKMTTKSF